MVEDGPKTEPAAVVAYAPQDSPARGNFAAACIYVVGLILCVFYTVGGVATTISAYQQMIAPPAAPGSFVLSPLPGTPSPKAMFYSALIDAGCSLLIFIGCILGLRGARSGRILVWFGLAVLTAKMSYQFYARQLPNLLDTRYRSTIDTIGTNAWTVAELLTWMVYPTFAFLLLRRRKVSTY